jgi:hypothetical protein
MNIRVVLEGVHDRSLWTRLLDDMEDGLSLLYHAAGGKNAARPVARRLQVQKREPLIFIADADTNDPLAFAEQKASYEDYFRWTSGGVPFHVVLFQPESKILFFRNAAIIENELRRTLDSGQVLAANVAPKALLESLLREKGAGASRFFSDLSEDTIAEFRKEPEVAAVRSFLNRVRSTETVLDMA